MNGPAGFRSRSCHGSSTRRPGPIVTANNAVVDDGYAYHIANAVGPGLPRRTRDGRTPGTGRGRPDARRHDRAPARYDGRPGTGRGDLADDGSAHDRRRADRARSDPRLGRPGAMSTASAARPGRCSSTACIATCSTTISAHWPGSTWVRRPPAARSSSFSTTRRHRGGTTSRRRRSSVRKQIVARALDEAGAGLRVALRRTQRLDVGPPPHGDIQGGNRRLERASVRSSGTSTMDRMPSAGRPARSIAPSYRFERAYRIRWIPTTCPSVRIECSRSPTCPACALPLTWATSTAPG